MPPARITPVPLTDVAIRKAKPAEQKRCRNEIEERGHGNPYFSLSAFSVTVKDEVDMAMAAMSGVARPTSATGTATAL